MKLQTDWNTSCVSEFMLLSSISGLCGAGGGGAGGVYATTKVGGWVCLHNLDEPVNTPPGVPPACVNEIATVHSTHRVTSAALRHNMLRLGFPPSLANRSVAHSFLMQKSNVSFWPQISLGDWLMALTLSSSLSRGFTFYHVCVWFHWGNYAPWVTMVTFTVPRPPVILPPPP